MVSMDLTDFVYRLMAGGDNARNDIIEARLLAGADILNFSGVELARNTIVEDSTRTLTSTAVGGALIPGWTLPTITYVGRPIELELYVPSITHPTAGAAVRFQFRDAAGVVLASGAPSVPVAAGNMFVLIKAVVPVSGQYALSPGDEITGLQCYGGVSAGTATIHSYWNNALLGSTPVIFRAVQQ
jgi:hypothetical protein